MLYEVITIPNIQDGAYVPRLLFVQCVKVYGNVVRCKSIRNLNTVTSPILTLKLTEVSEYFEANNTIQGFFDITEKIYGLKYEKVTGIV